MKRYATYLITAVICFAIGLLAKQMFRPSIISAVLNERTISLCELERAPEKYDGQWVRVKAVLYSDLGGPYIYDWSCGSQNIYTYPLIDLRGFDGLNPQLQDWSMNIGGLNDPAESLETDVIITGLFDKSYSEVSDDLGSHNFRIIPTRLEQLSPLHHRK